MDPCQLGAIADFQRTGLNIKKVTDDASIAGDVATDYGILQPHQWKDSIVVGEEFQNYTREERMAKVDRICAVASASPLDMLLMVQCLQEKGHVVAVIGNDTSDAAALRQADIGISVGLQAPNAAKESSDIVILDDDFISVVNVLKWGRTMLNCIQTFVQFQLTVSITTLVINFVIAVSASEPPTIKIVASISSGEVPLAALQLLWVK